MPNNIFHFSCGFLHPKANQKTPALQPCIFTTILTTRYSLFLENTKYPVQMYYQESCNAIPQRGD